MKKGQWLIATTLILLAPVVLKAQIGAFRDTIVQLSGVTLTADSLQAVPNVSVIIKGQNRGTITNDLGIFSIVAFKGDVIEFTAIGYKRKEIKIPTDLKGFNYSLIQLMVKDTFYLPVTIIRPLPTPEEFERAFLTMKFPDDKYEIARKNTDAAKLRALAQILPRDASESINQYFNKQAQALYYSGQQPPINLLNPAAWADFIQAWKRGDFKRKQ